jgi:hypothetical protein
MTLASILRLVIERTNGREPSLREVLESSSFPRPA